MDEEALIERVASPRRADAARTFLARFDPDTALESLVDADVTAICRHATQYPDGLRQLTDPPRVLYCTGSAERLEELLAQPAATQEMRPEGKGRNGLSRRSCSMSKKSFQTIPPQ